MTILVDETLKRARDLVAASWWNNEHPNRDVASVCAAQAIHKAAGRPDINSDAEMGALVLPAARAFLAAVGIKPSKHARPSIAALFACGDVMAYNEAAGRTQQDVVAAFEKAIEEVSR